MNHNNAGMCRSRDGCVSMWYLSKFQSSRRHQALLLASEVEKQEEEPETIRIAGGQGKHSGEKCGENERAVNQMAAPVKTGGVLQNRQDRRLRMRKAK